MTVAEMPPIEELLPHRGTMLLLDRIVAANESTIEAECVVPAAAWYLEAQGMPAWIGIEVMAQAIAAHVSLQTRARGDPPRPGVLLGSKRYRASVPCIEAGARLSISARLAYRDESGFAAYDCTISNDGRELAAASLKVFEPGDFEALLQQADPR